MTHEEYQRYLKTPRWRDIRRRVLHNDAECAKCKFPYELNVHHTSYARINTDDEIFDLIVLCRACHSRHHFSELESFGLYDRKALIKKIAEQTKAARKQNEAREQEVEENKKEPYTDAGPFYPNPLRHEP